MRTWRVSIPVWEIEIEADDEGLALVEADMAYNFMSEARAEEIETEDDDDGS